MMLRALTAASVLALAVATAQAAPVMDVKFSDLDLSNPSDAKVLEARVHRAADVPRLIAQRRNHLGIVDFTGLARIAEWEPDYLLYSGAP